MTGFRLDVGQKDQNLSHSFEVVIYSELFVPSFGRNSSKGEKSLEKKIPAGVPQGSVLGPLLFLIFINDIGHSIESITKLFADDTSMSVGLTNPDTRAEILTCDLVKISDWAKLWKVKFNEEKTELVNIKRDTKPIHQLTFGNVVLEDKPHHKHLGITLQSNCKWDEHISNISSKVNMLMLATLQI